MSAVPATSASVVTVPSKKAFLYSNDAVPKSIWLVVTGDNAPSAIVNLFEPPVAIVIILLPEKVIDVSVSPSPVIESSCISPTLVIALSLKLVAPNECVPVVAVIIPPIVVAPDILTEELASMSSVAVFICTVPSASISNCPSVDEFKNIAASLNCIFLSVATSMSLPSPSI